MKIKCHELHACGGGCEARCYSRKRSGICSIHIQRVEERGVGGRVKENNDDGDVGDGDDVCRVCKYRTKPANPSLK
jgi:hypothetical protein